MSQHLLERLKQLERISAEEEAEILGLPASERHFSRGEDVVKQGSSPTFSCLLLDGFAARYKVLQDGQRQITALHVPGDFVDLHSFLLKRMDHAIIAVTDCRVAIVPHDKLREVTERLPHLTRVLWLTTLIDGAIHREWVVAIGRRTAAQHFAHLICELYLRLEAVGLIHERSFELPLTQAEIADTLGLSPVHTNRVVQELRRSQLLSWRSHILTVHDFDALTKLAEFDPSYLNLDGKPV